MTPLGGIGGGVPLSSFNQTPDEGEGKDGIAGILLLCTLEFNW